MLSLLKYGLMAAMLFAGVSGAQAQVAKGQPRVSVDFNTLTGCWKSEVSPQIGYNVDLQEKGLFLFLRLGKFGVNKAETMATLTSWSGRPIALDRYVQKSDAVIYQKLDKDVYVLNVTAKAEILVCQSKENGLVEPEVRLPNPATVPGYVDVKMPQLAVSEPEQESGEIHIPDYFEPLTVSSQKCLSLTSRATAFVINSTKDNQYIIVRSRGPKSTVDEGNNRKWENRPPRLLPAHASVSDIIEMTEHDNDFAMAQLGRKGRYWLFFDAHIYGDVLGDLDVCIGPKVILKAASQMQKRR